MSALRAAGALSAVALVLLPSATAASSAQVAFTAGGRTDRGDVVVVNADGSGFTNLTPGQANSFDDDRDPSWSPGGARIAFVSHRDASNTQEIYVMNAEGTGVRRLTSDSGDGRTFNVDPAWSPDGGRIAWRKAGQNSTDEIWVMNADGSGQRRLTTDAGQKSAPRWSPDSGRLLYSRTSPAHVFVVAASGGPVRDLTPQGTSDSNPAWSPDGARIAMTSNDAISVMNADGSARRRVSVTRGVGPAWSPDGTQLAFTGLRLFPEFGSRYGPATRSDVFIVGADGKDERRLTGPVGEGYSYVGGGSGPTWWPDGARLFFLSSRTAADAASTTYVMNADGTCEGRFAPLVPAPLQDPAWRPGLTAAAGRLSCVDLRVDVLASTGYVGLRQSVVYHVSVENDGSLPATGVRLELIVPSPVTATANPALGTCGVGAKVVCDLGPLAPGRETALEVFARSPAAGTIRIPVSVTADQAESDPSSNSRVAETIVLPCTVVGTEGNDAIYGTGKRDVICARPGWDRVNALGGNDTIKAGSGNDTVDAGKGRDTVSGEGGADVIVAQDGQRDVIDCGTESDLVVADRIDKVARDCERVMRA